MNETFDTEAILREMLEVLRKHKIPIETVSLNVSMLDAAFVEHIPQLKDHEEWPFHKSKVVDGVPMLFHAQRRYPFNDIVQLLEQQIVPPTQAFAEKIRHEFPRLKVDFEVTPVDESSRTVDMRFYEIHVGSRFNDDPHADYNRLNLSIIARQYEATDYPKLQASVGWLVDHEPGEWGWGLDEVYNALHPHISEYTPRRLRMLETALPDLYRAFREEILKKQGWKSKWFKF